MSILSLTYVAAGALNDAGGDRPAAGECVRVAQVGRLGGEVAGAGVGALAFFGGVADGGGAAADARGDLGGFAVEDLGGLGGDPGLGVRVAGLEETPGRFPAIFQHVDEVDQDGDRHAAAGRFGFDGLDLGAVPVDQGYPGALAGRVAALRLSEPGADHGGMPAVMEVVTHLPAATGATAGGRRRAGSLAGRAMMSAAVRGTGAQS